MFNQKVLFYLLVFLPMGNPLALISKRDAELEVGMDQKRLELFRQDCLHRHNELRKRHGSPDLKVNKNLELLAQEWAERNLESRRLEYRPNQEYGENISYKFTIDNRSVSGSEIANMWYDDKKNYDFGNPGFSKNGGSIDHFTQVVWANTTEVGIGMAEDGNGLIFVVANYYPPGNYKGKYKENVKKLP